MHKNGFVWYWLTRFKQDTIKVLWISNCVELLWQWLFWAHSLHFQTFTAVHISASSDKPDSTHQIISRLQRFKRGQIKRHPKCAVLGTAKPLHTYSKCPIISSRDGAYVKTKSRGRDVVCPMQIGILRQTFHHCKQTFEPVQMDLHFHCLTVRSWNHEEIVLCMGGRWPDWACFWARVGP